MRRLVLLTLWCAAVMWAGFAPPAHAYLDPATTSYLIQIVSALVIGASVAIGVFFRRIQTFLVTVGPRFAAWRARGFTRAANPDRTARAWSSGSVVDAELAAAVEAALGGGTAVPGWDGGAGTRGEAARGGDASGESAREKLFGDDRTWLRRLPLALAATFGLAVPFLVTGPVELYARNVSELPFLVGTLVGTGAAAAGIVGVGAGLLVSLLRGRVFDLVVSLLVGAGLASWVQSLFLNLNTGAFMGNQFPWNDYLGRTLGNLAIWAVLIGLPLLVRFLHRRAWRWVVLLVPGLIVAAGIVSAVGAARGLPAVSPDQSNRYLTTAGLDKVSAGKNIIVFLVDATDQSVIRDLAQQPDFSFAPLDGFTSFDQTVARYQETFPALPFMFTGEDYLWDGPRAKYFTNGYKNATFFPDLKRLGYTVNLFTAPEDVYGSPADVDGVVDNLSPSSPAVDHVALMRGMARLAAFGRSPLALQPSLWLDPGAFGGVLRAGSEADPPYVIDDPALYREILAHPLTTDGNAPRLTFIHMYASHQPFIMDAQARLVGEARTNRIEQTKGAFMIIYTYLDQLRALGLYDSSTILIMADHGTHLGWSQRLLDEPLLPCLLIKPAGAAGTPLQHSMAATDMTNFAPTIIEAAGGDPAPYGLTYFQAPAVTAEPRRFYWIRPPYMGYPGVLEVFDITGNALDFDNWKRLADIPMTGGYNQ